MHRKLDHTPISVPEVKVGILDLVLEIFVSDASSDAWRCVAHAACPDNSLDKECVVTAKALFMSGVGGIADTTHYLLNQAHGVKCGVSRALSGKLLVCLGVVAALGESTKHVLGR